MECLFSLNGQPMSTLRCGPVTVPAFSGLGDHANRREFACLAGAGPIPPGAYYIFDRQTGGLLAPFRDLFSDHSNWFALYAIDGKVDDETFCNRVKRGAFRLHPRGIGGISYGCVVVDGMGDYHHVRALIRRNKPQAVPGTSLKAYGRLIVQ